MKAEGLSPTEAASDVLPRGSRAGGIEVLSTPRVMGEPAARLCLEAELYLALQRDEFTLHYQPQVRVEDLAITGFEALVRWQHPTRGLVGPDEFIDTAEQTGLIVPLGEWVLQSACAQACAWQSEGFPRLRISVNVSPWQLGYGRLVACVHQVLAHTGLDADCLELEIIESSVMGNPGRAMEVAGNIRALGVGLALDDFGVDYSNFANLKRFPVQRIKIDRSFLDGVPFDIGNVAIVRAILAMVRELGLRVVAEGVETEMQVAFLREQSCDEFQGYVLSRPLPAEAVPQFLMSKVSSSAFANRASDS